MECKVIESTPLTFDLPLILRRENLGSMHHFLEPRTQTIAPPRVHSVQFWEERRVRIVSADRKGQKVSFQIRQKRHLKRLPIPAFRSFLREIGNRLSIKLNASPCQARSVTDAHSSARSQKDHPLPFSVSNRQQIRNLRHCECRACCACCPQKLHRLRRIRQDQALPSRKVEGNAERFHRHIRRHPALSLFHLGIPKRLNIRRNDARKRSLRLRRNVFQEVRYSPFVPLRSAIRLRRRFRNAPAVQKVLNRFRYHTGLPTRFQNVVQDFSCLSLYKPAFPRRFRRLFPFQGNCQCLRPFALLC